ncbi:MAG: hypothetical protein EXS16_15810 [Gemmataceae bacterium]|nr:hypothetical protein [Gemmataceae bacterium]
MNNRISSNSDEGRFTSEDCIDVWVDEEGDHTVRPMPEYRVAKIKAEQARWRAVCEAFANATKSQESQS